MGTETCSAVKINTFINKAEMKQTTSQVKVTQQENLARPGGLIFRLHCISQVLNFAWEPCFSLFPGAWLLPVKGGSQFVCQFEHLMLEK